MDSVANFTADSSQSSDAERTGRPQDHRRYGFPFIGRPVENTASVVHAEAYFDTPRYFDEWLHKNRLPSYVRDGIVVQFEQSHVTSARLIDLYLFGFRYHIPRLCQVTLHLIYAYFQTQALSQCFRFEEFYQICSEVREDSALFAFAVNLMVFGCNNGTGPQISADNQTLKFWGRLGQPFWRAFATRLEEIRYYPRNDALQIPMNVERWEFPTFEHLQQTDIIAFRSMQG